MTQGEELTEHDPGFLTLISQRIHGELNTYINSVDA